MTSFKNWKKTTFLKKYTNWAKLSFLDLKEREKTKTDISHPWLLPTVWSQLLRQLICYWPKPCEHSQTMFRDLFRCGIFCKHFQTCPFQRTWCHWLDFQCSSFGRLILTQFLLLDSTHLWMNFFEIGLKYILFCNFFFNTGIAIILHSINKNAIKALLFTIIFMSKCELQDSRFYKVVSKI